MTRRHDGVVRSMRVLLAGAVLLAAACTPPDSGDLTERLSIATGGTGGVYYPYGGGLAKVISDRIAGVEVTAEVTAGTVDNLKFIAAGSADLGFALADSLADAAMGRGIFEEFGPVPARALAVLYDNYNHVVTWKDSGVDTIARLRGRVVSTGAPGSGTEVSAVRILSAAGVDPAAVRRQSLGVAPSVDALRDGKIDAFFWSGGIPTGSVLDAATTLGRTIRILPSASLLPALQRDHGSAVYHAAEIPAATYPGLTEDVPVIAVSNVLVVHASMEPDLARRILAAIFAGRSELATIHPMAAVLSHATAVVGSPIPFHDGAVTYYREQDAWREAP